MSPPPEFRPSSTLLLREVPAYAGTVRTGMLAQALADVLCEASIARCRVYALVDLARPAGAPPLAEALVETDQSGAVARLRALTVAPPYRGRGLGRRMLGDLLTELRAGGVRRVRYRAESAGDGRAGAPGCAVPPLLRSAGFHREDERSTSEDEQHIVPKKCDNSAVEAVVVVWCAREL